MIWIILFASIICVVGLIVTLIAMNSTDSNYSNEKSMSTFSKMYLILVPMALIVVVIIAFLF